MAGAADLAAKEASAAVDRATDAGAEREHEDIAAVFRGSGPDFAEQGGVGIIEHAAVAVEEGGPVEFFEPVHASGHPVDASAVRIGQTGRGETDGELLALPRFEFVNDLAHGDGKLRRVALELAITRRFRKRGERFRRLRVHKRGFDVRAAEVDADG